MPTPNGNITTSEIWTSPTEPTTTPEKTPEAEEKEEE